MRVSEPDLIQSHTEKPELGFDSNVVLRSCYEGLGETRTADDVFIHWKFVLELQNQFQAEVPSGLASDGVMQVSYCMVGLW